MPLKEYINSGIILAETQIFIKLRGIKHFAKIKKNGTIELETGELFKSPSGAAKFLNNNKPIDGWLRWRIVDTPDITLDYFRKYT